MRPPSAGPRLRHIPMSQWRPISRDEAMRLSAMAREAFVSDGPPPIVTGRQVMAARIALGLTLDGVAARADVSAGVVDLFERYGKADRFDRERIVGTLECAGAAFVADGDLAGVFFRK